MGRPAEGPKVFWKRGWAYVRFTWQGREYRDALGTRDSAEAATSAARAYSDVVSGRRRPVVLRPGKLLDLGELWEEWRAWKRPSIDVETDIMIGYYGDRFVDSFKSLDRITKATAATYSLVRLGQVSRSTVLKEICFLRQFLAWCEDNRTISSAPVIPPLPPKAKGKRVGPQRVKPVEITPDEARRIIEKLPEHSKTIDGRKWPIRDRFAFMWETALRPASISRLRVPEHWRPGQRAVELEDEDDKGRFGRTVDLTPMAIAILRRQAPKSGPIFGDHCFTKALKAAARAVLGPQRAKGFAPYDFRHGRAKALLDAGASLRGVAYVLGHKRPSTTDKYLAPDRRAGREALAVSAPFSPPKGRMARKSG